MLRWFKELDRILRGDATHLSALDRGSVEVPAFGLTVVVIILGVTYGACMGTFALLRPGGPEFMQLFASAVKTPALFLVTLIITFPSLYVFNALVGSKLLPLAVLRLLIASLGVNLAVLASLGPIVAFFSVTTTSYPFIVLLNVLIFAVAGILGLNFLLQTLHRLTVAQLPPIERSQPPPRPALAPASEARIEIAPVTSESSDTAAELIAAPPTKEGAPEPSAAASSVQHSQPAPSSTVTAAPPQTGALERLQLKSGNAQVRSIFRCWIFVFGAVGAQVGWLMRPFIGNPNQPFEWFRPRESNFFEAVLRTFWSLFY